MRRRRREGHLDELHDQEQLTRRLVHLDQLDDAGVSHPPQHRHFVFYQMLLFSHTPDGLSGSHPCQSSPQKWRTVPAHLPAAAGLVDDLQRVLLPRGPANQTSLSNVSAASGRAAPRWEKTRLSDSSHAPHLSTHSLTTAKFPSPMTLPIWYFSLMRGEEMERLPFTARRREDGSKRSKIQGLFLNILLVFLCHTQKNKAAFTRARTFGVMLRGSVNVRGGGAARRLRRERFNVKPCQAVTKISSKISQRP